MNFLEALKFTVSVIRSIALQLSDNISDIWSSIVLFRGEIVIIQVFDEDISSLAIAKQDQKVKSNWHGLPACKNWLNFSFRGQFEMKTFILRHI